MPGKKRKARSIESVEDAKEDIAQARRSTRTMTSNSNTTHAYPGERNLKKVKPTLKVSREENSMIPTLLDGPVIRALGRTYFESIPTNILKVSDRYSWGYPSNQLRYLYDIRKTVVIRELQSFKPDPVLVKFQRRITALEWHPRMPYIMAAACKGGDIVLANGRKNDDGEIVFKAKKIQTGSGPGGAIFSLKFNPENTSVLYSASLEGSFKCTYLDDPSKSIVYHDTQDWNHWYTAMDVSYFHKTILGCDSKGFARLHHIDGQEITTIRMHNRKIHHCEFNKTLQYLLATASLESGGEVCLWDIRNLKPRSPLQKLAHAKGANVATFSYSGSRLLTNDQCNEIKVFQYQAPDWNEVRVIQHPHRQFQHLTPIECSWHPLHDLIVIGRYPTYDEGKGKEIVLRPVEIIDPEAQDKENETVCRLYHPSNGIVSLNRYNSTGEVLASGMGLNLLTWQADKRLDRLEGTKRGGESLILKGSIRNALRGRRDGDDDEDDDDLKKRSKKKAKTSVEENLKTKKSTSKTKSAGGSTRPKK